LHKLAIFLKFQISFTLLRYETALGSSNITQEGYGARLSKYVAYFKDLRTVFFIKLPLLLLFLFFIYNLTFYTCK